MSRGLLMALVATSSTPGFRRSGDTGRLETGGNKIRSDATVRRAQLNNRRVVFLRKSVDWFSDFCQQKPVKPESVYTVPITTQMIADAINSKVGISIDRRAVEIQPCVRFGEHKARIRLTTMVLVP